MEEMQRLIRRKIPETPFLTAASPFEGKPFPPEQLMEMLLLGFFFFFFLLTPWLCQHICLCEGWVSVAAFALPGLPVVVS